ncbi:MAG TPA: hypothetical protein VLJ76_08660 [Gaiellaceae bacterium]|nr:hypothetical protein [Gaiellaceae bacterium]
MARRLLIAVCFAFLVVGTGIAAADGPPQGISENGTGVASPDGTVRYVTLADGSKTLLEVVNARNGSVENWVWLKGVFALPAIGWAADGLSADGKTLVLTTYPWVGRSKTFLVLRVPNLTTKRVVTLKGAWSYDAISPNALTLYLIQGQPGRYLVRAYDLHQGRLLKRVIADRREQGPMTGSPVTRAASPGGRWDYTLYLRGNGTGFIHALDTVRRAAVCIDLPWQAMDSWVYSARLWVSRDGRAVHLREVGVNGRTAVVDTRTWKLRVSSPI